MTKEFEVIHLDVGGKKFSTYYDTLKTSIYFQELIKNKQGEQATVVGTADSPIYFIDRDGHVFQEIMHYLRSYSIRKNGEEDLKKLKVEAAFFKFNVLVAEVDRVLTEADQLEDEACYYIEDTSGKKAKFVDANGEMKLNVDTNTKIVETITFKGPNGNEQSAVIHKSSKQKAFYKTLVKANYFKQLLDDESMSCKTFVNDGKEIFVDRSEDLFREVLYFLRTGLVLSVGEERLQSLKNEADFYQVDDMVALIDSEVERQAEETNQVEILVKNATFLNGSSATRSNYLIQEVESNVFKIYQIVGVIEPHCLLHAGRAGTISAPTPKILLRPTKKKVYQFTQA
ncbi:hypothetical protein MBANPS3_000891 [Mucor bainieri]